LTYSVLLISQWVSAAFLTLLAAYQIVKFMIENIADNSSRDSLWCKCDRVTRYFCCYSSFLLYTRNSIKEHSHIYHWYHVRLERSISFRFCLVRVTNLSDRDRISDHDDLYHVDKKRTKKGTNVSSFTESKSHHIFDNSTGDLPRRKVDFVTFENAVIFEWPWEFRKSYFFCIVVQNILKRILRAIDQAAVSI